MWVTINVVHIICCSCFTESSLGSVIFNTFIMLSPVDIIQGLGASMLGISFLLLSLKGFSMMRKEAKKQREQ